MREDRVHGEMHQALQRLLREKELEFDSYDVTVDELKEFVRIRPGQSVYYGPDDDSPSARSATPPASERGSNRTSTPRDPGVPLTSPRAATSRTAAVDPVPGRGRDLLQRLMEKGLIPLAALDVIRGWMLLEMATPGEEDRRLIRAATRNKLGYQDIRQALLSMYEEKSTPYSIGASQRW